MTKLIYLKLSYRNGSFNSSASCIQRFFNKSIAFNFFLSIIIGKVYFKTFLLN